MTVHHSLRTLPDRARRWRSVIAGAPVATDDLLTGPIRGELLGTEGLAERARAIAREQVIRESGVGERRTPLLSRLEETARILRDARARLARAVDTNADVGPAGDWLLDNAHIIDEHVREIRESLPRSYYGELPELASGHLAGYPRIYEVATTLIGHTEGRVERANVDLFISAFQEITLLSIGELWAIPAMLRLALIESVRRMSLRTVQRLDELDAADRWAERIIERGAPRGSAMPLALNEFLLEHPPLTPAFVSRFLRQLRQTDDALSSLVWLEPWMAEEGVSADLASAQANERLALTHVITANSITSLRVIAHLDWKMVVEQHSAMERALREDPSKIYSQMTFATRDHYRHIVERIARRVQAPEVDVAELAVKLAEDGQYEYPDDVARGHVGYYLVDDGLSILETAARYTPNASEKLYRAALRHPNVVFFGGMLLGTVALLMAGLSFTHVALFPDGSAWQWQTLDWRTLLLVLGVTLLPAHEVAVALLQQVITALLSPRRLPKLEFSGRDGIPSEFRTAVVVPTLFESIDSVYEALGNLEVQFLANRESHLHFAVLSDFADSSTETQPDDAEIVRIAEEGVRALNARYAAGRDDEFYLFHRPRKWNAQQGVWMGWERKRGKLAEFNRFVRGGANDAFSSVVGDIDTIRKVRFAITLDADTVLPPDAAPLLVGALAHPLNRAVYDAARARVVRGFGILQPRVGVSLPSAYRSRFAAIHSGHPGVDPYTTAVSDVYQDLYGEGSFTGKGIYDIDAFEQATHGRFPENTLLSHDLIEGNYARAGLATDIEVYDDYPTHYLSHARRKHRWIRGDWQLLGWISRWVPGIDGPERNRLSLLSRWKLLDNLRRSVIEGAQLILILAGWTVLPGSPVRWTALALLSVAAPWIIALTLAAVRPPGDKSWRAYYRAVAQDAWTSVQQVALAVVFLPHQAWISADAILRTLWRVSISRRNLLQWQTAQSSDRVVSARRRESAVVEWRAMAPAIITATVIALSVLTLAALGLTRSADAHWGWLALSVVPLSVLWLVSPNIAHKLSASAIQRVRRITQAVREMAMRYARAHWQFFETFVTAETHWLAPDNFQADPAPIVAMRTSPTNIGLQLLSTMSARDLGFISLATMIEKLELAFGTMNQLRRTHGHFFNWYDLNDLRVLEPGYISTVDSANLAGHLIAVRQACVELQTAADATPELAARLHVLGEQAGEFAESMDFKMLYDPDRELFSIGYSESSRSLDSSSYDLLASEARLASFLAIASDQVPVDHWFRLGRTLTRTGGETVLVSWSGSMFEYLMPALVMRAFPLTVLDQTSRGAVQLQIDYGADRGVPWGISESAYNLRDRHLTYQYRAFGVPNLALKRGLGRDLVVAPYATALAAMVEPTPAFENLAALEQRGALGQYGFYDALDYTRPEPGARFALVKNFMAHHIGMSLVAFTNVLTRDIWPQRFHTDPLVRSAELLLHERIPRRLVFQTAQSSEADEALPSTELERPAVREIDTPDTPLPRVALLGHLPYTVMVNNRGTGYSRYEGLAVTRWRADSTLDHIGQFCYIKDVGTGAVWSAAHQPVCAPYKWYHAHFATDRISFHRADGDLETRTEITVVPGDAAEVRRVTVINKGRTVREVELTSYSEVVLTTPEADRAHPAFANLFVETEWHAWCSAIFATRRPRSSTESPVWGVHVAAIDGTLVEPVSYETDRAHFVGRGRTTRMPAALDDRADGKLSGTTGSVLDPVFALRARVRIEPGSSASVAFTTLVATSRERAFELADRYDDVNAAQRALDLAWTTAQVELRELNITPSDAAVFQDFAGHLLYADRALGAPALERARNRGSQPLLWTIGISGDAPILVASIDSPDGLSTLKQVLSAHSYWRRRGLKVDLVVLDTHRPSYLQDHHERIVSAVRSSPEATMLDQPGGVFIRRSVLLDPTVLLMLRATARVHITCDGRPLSRTLERVTPDLSVTAGGLDQTPPARPERHTPPVVRTIKNLTSRLLDLPAEFLSTVIPPLAPVRVPTTTRPASLPPLQFDNGLGGLTEQGDYEIRLRGGALPPAPWANVIANARGGFVVTERGCGFTWAENSYFYRLTPWHNDPVVDPIGEVIYIRDEESGEVWSVTPAPIRHETHYVVKHGAGWSTFAHDHDGVGSQLTLSVAPQDPVKLLLLRLTNQTDRPRKLSVTVYIEWTLGVLREQTRQHIHTSFDASRRTVLARNAFDQQFADRVAFVSLSEELQGYTTDRREFVGRNGTLSAPVGLNAGAILSGRVSAAEDPCAALQCLFEIAPGETRELSAILGAGAGETDAQSLMDRYSSVDAVSEAIAQTTLEWQRRLSVVRVSTPEPMFDAMVNRWSLYQTLACRVWARSALYQSSGAYGFRDQLQDAMALLYAEPALAREHILRAAARQFPEGDVQHWWHPQSGRGVRTKFSDDLAWLPYVVEQYTQVTGDLTVLDEYVPFVNMRALAEDEHELYDLPIVTDEHASIYEHCRRALSKACTRGTHGLPLIGIGDWNDGMSRVGVEGRGESVWLAWFLIVTLRDFAEHAARRGDQDVATAFRQHADNYAAAVEAHGWDGAWYRRAYFDDGTPLGSAQSDECKIDAIAQSWSVISGAGSPQKQALAMKSMEEHLVREDARVLMLLTPPFNRGTHDPGYIKGYLPGVRENGAQYTHAALWSVLATAKLGKSDRAFELFQMLNPLMHARTPEEVQTYKVEPYVIAADVYTAQGQLGRGGWTWYTGSASWMYRVALETLLGFTKRGDRLSLSPCVPTAWPGFTIEYNFGTARYAITVELLDSGDPSLVVDGQTFSGREFKLVDDGAIHIVKAKLPRIAG